MNNLRIKTRIFLAIFSGIFLALLVGISSLTLLDSITDEMDTIAEEHIPLTMLISEIQHHQWSQSGTLERILRLYFMQNGQHGVKNAEQEFWRQSVITNKKIKESIEAVTAAIRSSSSKETPSRLNKIFSYLQSIDTHHDHFDQQAKRLFGIFANEQTEKSKRLIEQIEEKEALFHSELIEFQREVMAFTAESVQTTQRHEKTGYYNILILLSVGCLSGLLLTMIIARSILVPLKHAVIISERIAANDLDIEVGPLEEHELGRLLASMENMAHSLKNAQENLEKKVEELARSNADLQQFAYVASHDLQEPLRTIASFSQLLAERYQGKLDSDADEFIAFIVAAANEMRTLIDDLLTFSRISTHAKPMEIVGGEALIHTILSRLQTVIQNENAVITCGKMPNFHADKGQMIQLFQNLISNAIKFHGKEPPQVHIQASRQQDTWVFSVKDNGIGIDAKYGKRIFEVFQRLHTKEAFSGTGIGLAVCKKIVERHGGKLTVISKPGKGATFFVSIPNYKGNE